MKRIEDLSIVINARVQSTRVEKKLIRPFANTTLLDLALNRLDLLPCSNKYLAASEPQILKIYQNYNKTIGLLRREKEAIVRGKAEQKVTFAHYANISTPYIMSINPCMPFVENNTYLSAITFFVENSCRTMTSIKKRLNVFFDENLIPINVQSTAVSSQGNKNIYELAHAFHIFEKKQFVKNGYFWDYTEGNPELFVVSGNKQLLDIDDEDDFSICESVYKNEIL